MSKRRTPLDELAKLLENPSHNLSVDVYNGNKKTIKEPGVKRHKSKYTLNDIGDALFAFIKSTNTRLDNLEKRLDKVEARLDNLEKRLDKVEARLDYNGLQIEQINKRLDYNNLKKLPEDR